MQSNTSNIVPIFMLFYMGSVFFQCVRMPGTGFRRGGYNCECADGYYYHPSTNTNNRFYNGSQVETQYLLKLLNQSNSYDRDFQCLPCATGCIKCNNDSPCFAEYDVMMRGIPLGVESFCMTISLVLGFVIIRLRKAKVIENISPSNITEKHLTWGSY